MLYHHQSQQIDHQLPSLDKVKELLEKGANLSAAFDTVYCDILLSYFLVYRVSLYYGYNLTCTCLILCNMFLVMVVAL